MLPRIWRSFLRTSHKPNLPMLRGLYRLADESSRTVVRSLREAFQKRFLRSVIQIPSAFRIGFKPLLRRKSVSCSLGSARNFRICGANSMILKRYFEKLSFDAPRFFCDTL